MLKRIVLLAIPSFIMLNAFIIKPKQPQQELPSSLHTAKSEVKGFALIELFTSEGCSSCPPADALIEKINKELQGKPVYILAYHVDYWDKLGWKDVFSSPVYTARQAHYATWLDLPTIYTPQVVVNGTREFVGSDERLLRGTIAEAFFKTPKNNIQLIGRKINLGRIAIDYKIKGPLAGLNLVIALVQPAGTSSILKGENRGRTLSHIQVVRQVQTIQLNGKQDGNNLIAYNNSLIAYPQVVAFLQDAKTGEVTAASKIDWADLDQPH